SRCDERRPFDRGDKFRHLGCDIEHIRQIELIYDLFNEFSDSLTSLQILAKADRRRGVDQQAKGLSAEVLLIERVAEGVRVGVSASAVYGVDGQEAGFDRVEGAGAEQDGAGGGVGELSGGG